MHVLAIVTCRSLVTSFQSKSPELGTFCGSTIPSLIRSSGNSLYITLNSDDADTGSGFQAVWREVSNDVRKYHSISFKNIMEYDLVKKLV